MKRIPTLALSLLLLAIAGPALAHETGKAHGHDAAATTPTMTRAEVRKVDKSAKKIILKHEAIENLSMDAMTMVFQVKDEAMLDQVKAGDRVRFTADKIKGAYVVLSIEIEKQ